MPRFPTLVLRITGLNFASHICHFPRRLVHSDGSLVDLSVDGALDPQLLLEESGGQREVTDEKWMNEEEEEYSCVFDKESLSDTITGKCSSWWSSSLSPYHNS